MDRNQTHHEHGLSRDAAGIGPHARPGVRLVSLRELADYAVAAGEADVRGWEVRTVSGRELGKVADLLVDADAHEVVMLDIDLHGTDRHTLAPVRAAQIDRARRVVTLDSADLQDSGTLPSLKRDTMPTDDEGRQFHDRYQQAYGARGWDKDRDYQVSRGDHDVEFRRRDAEDVARQDAELAQATEQDARRREAERQESQRMEAERRRMEEARRAQASQWTQGVQDAQGTTPGAQAGSLPAQTTQHGGRELRWAQGQEEIVVERRPVIEEVIIRRRVVNPQDIDQSGDAKR